MQWPLSLDLFQVNKSGQTPLHSTDNVGIAQMLLDAGASLSIPDKDGDTPLYLAVLRNNLDVVKLLAPLSDLSLVGTDLSPLQSLAMATKNF